jgi:hypothetical protein
MALTGELKYPFSAMTSTAASRMRWYFSPASPPEGNGRACEAEFARMVGLSRLRLFPADAPPLVSRTLAHRKSPVRTL